MNNHTEYNGITSAFILLGTNDTQSVVSTVTKNLQTMIDSRETVSCYGIEDQNAEINMDYISPNANNLTVKQEIEQGIVPHAILADGVHYTTGTKTVIGDLIYKRCKELNIF